MSQQKSHYDNYSDEALMQRYQKDADVQIFEVIYRRHFQSLCKYIAWVSGQSVHTEDIAQNILVKLFHKPNLFDATKNLKVWLFVAAKNQIKNEHRNVSTRSRHLEIIKSTTNSFYEIDPSPNQNTRLHQVQDSIQQLSQDHREVITLKYSNNLTIKEISEVLGCSEGTVKSRLFYAIKNMKTQVITNKIHE